MEQMELPQSEESLEGQIMKIVQSELQKIYAKMQESSPRSSVIVQAGGTATYTAVYNAKQLSSASPSPCCRLKTSCVLENPHESAASCFASHMNSTTAAQIHGGTELTTTQDTQELPPLEAQQSPVTNLREAETAAPEVRSRHRTVVWRVFALIMVLVSCVAIVSVKSFVAQVKPLSADGSHKHFLGGHSIPKLEFKDFRVPKKYQELFLQGYRKMGAVVDIFVGHAANYLFAGSSKPIDISDDDLATDRTNNDPATFPRHDRFSGPTACATCCWVLQGQGETSWVESQEGASGVDKEIEEDNDGLTVPVEVVNDDPRRGCEHKQPNRMDQDVTPAEMMQRPLGSYIDYEQAFVGRQGSRNHKTTPGDLANLQQRLPEQGECILKCEIVRFVTY